MVTHAVAYAGSETVLAKARDIEQRLSARVGIAIFESRTDRRWLYNAHQRFPMASTFKVLACGALLHQVDIGAVNLDQLEAIEASDLVEYSPVLEKFVGRTISLRDLCAATLATSDNAAANKILGVLGGPDGLTKFMRSIEDDTTRLDRLEPALNEAAPGDPRDTSSPLAMTTALQKLVLGDLLSPSSREILTAWLENCEVSGLLLRAGIPSDWRIADRTGSGGHGTRAIVAVMWPPGRAPLIAAIYLTETNASVDARNHAIAELGKALAMDVLN